MSRRSKLVLCLFVLFVVLFVAVQLDNIVGYMPTVARHITYAAVSGGCDDTPTGFHPSLGDGMGLADVIDCATQSAQGKACK